MSRPGQEKGRRGRRPGGLDTRGSILDAARLLFASQGFARTSVRAIARHAHVDPALVLHYFGTKENVFRSAIQLPFEPEAVLPALLEGDRATLGERVARFVVTTLEDDASRARVLAIIRAAASEPAAAALLREVVERRIRDPIAHALGTADAELRASLFGSQVVGLAMARYVVGVEPLASLRTERLVTLIAPTFQRYLVNPLEPRSARAGRTAEDELDHSS
jgi:AcrR family transcriptional regulator